MEGARTALVDVRARAASQLRTMRTSLAQTHLQALTLQRELGDEQVGNGGGGGGGGDAHGTAGVGGGGGTGGVACTARHGTGGAMQSAYEQRGVWA